jgi:hypothetical protein
MTERLIDKLRADLKALTKRVEILGVAVFVAPLTVAESSRVTAMHPNDAAQRQAEILVLKCRDEDGNPVFTKDDKPALVRDVAGDRFTPIFAVLNGASVDAQAEK